MAIPKLEDSLYPFLVQLKDKDVTNHIGQIYEDEEQGPERTHKRFFLVRQEGNRSVRRNMLHYNLDIGML